jgi:membrane protein
VSLGLATLKQTYERWNADKAPRLAAALSFTTLFAIAPIFVILIAIAGQVLGWRSGGEGDHLVEDELLTAIRRSAGQGAADMVQAMVSATYTKPHHGVIATIVGWVVLIFGALGLFSALHDSLNTVWHVAEPKEMNLWRAIRGRVIGIAMLLAIGFLLLLTTAVNAVIGYVSTFLTHLLPFPGAGTFFGVIDALVEVAIITLLIAVMYKMVPDAEIRWRDVWPGAFVTAFAFVVGQWLIALYLARAGVTSAYGAAGALIALLLWVYYSSMIMLFGAEFTCVWAERFGTGRRPSTAAAAPVDQAGSRPLLERLDAAEDREDADEHGKAREKAQIARHGPA